LVAVEAMARGVPVVASYQGAMPELVEPGVNGYLARGVQTGAARLRDAVAKIDRRRCFESARARFSWEVTGKTYLDILWRALHDKAIASTPSAPGDAHGSSLSEREKRAGA
ncbi:MAG TPA: glycosyltransferase, partial [Ktedonobacterales bacterium]|nr:glycosyltransferase [Ktedonobacterales bacterium]